MKIGKPTYSSRGFGLSIQTSGYCKGEWGLLLSRFVSLSWDHCNPEYQYKRVLHVCVGRLVFSVGRQ